MAVIGTVGESMAYVPTLFQKRHYEVVEEALANVIRKHPEMKGAVTEVALELAQEFANDNPRFRATLFVQGLWMKVLPVDLTGAALIRSNRIKPATELAPPTTETQQ